MITCTITSQQAKTLAEKVAAHNAAFASLVEYFGAVVDGLGLPRETTFTSIDPATGVLVVTVPDDG